MKLAKCFLAPVGAVFWVSVSSAKEHPKPKPRVAVILPTDESNFNAVGNVLNCMVRAVFESWHQQGYEFDAEFFNDRRDAMQAASVAEVVAKKHFDVAIGTTLSSQALIVSKILDKNGVPFIAPLATHPDVVQGKKFSMRLPFNDELQGRMLARFTHSALPAIKSVLVIENESLPYSTFLSQKYEIQIKLLIPGIKVTKLKYIDGQFRKEDVVKAYSENQADVVFVPLYSLDVAGTYSALASVIKKNTLLLSSDTVGAGDTFYNAMGPENKLLKFDFVQHNPKEFSGSHAQKFKVLHLEKCGKYDLTMNSAAGFDLADSTLTALFSKGYGSNATSFKKIYLDGAYDGTLGKLRFGKDGEPQKPIHIYTIQNRAVIYKESLK